MRQLTFPTYEHIKSLPREDEETGFYHDYYWLLFETPVNVDGRLTYNDGDRGMISFDVFEGGYSGMNGLDMELKFTKANYAKVCKHAQRVFEDFYKALDEDPRRDSCVV